MDGKIANLGWWSVLNQVDITNKVAETAPVGCRIITVDRKLKGKQFKLLKEIDDPRGDLQLLKGFVYEKISE